MLSLQLVALALLAFSGLCLSSSPQQLEHPYAPELYSRDQLDVLSGSSSRNPASGMIKRVVSSRAVPGDAQPYAPELYYRSALQDTEEQRDTAVLSKRSTHLPSTHGRRVRYAGQTCKRAHDVCDQGLFCSTVTATCKHQRSLGAGCRTNDGCTGALLCLNYKCHKKASSHGHPSSSSSPSPPKQQHPQQPQHPKQQKPDHPTSPYEPNHPKAPAHPAPSGSPSNKRELHYRRN